MTRTTTGERTRSRVGWLRSVGQPHGRSAQQNGAEGPAERGCAHTHILEPGGEDHEGDDRAYVAVGDWDDTNEPMRTAATLPMQRRRDRQFDMSEGQNTEVAARVSGTAWVGRCHQVVGSQDLVGEQQHHDHQGPRSDRSDAHNDPPTIPMAPVRPGRRVMLWTKPSRAWPWRRSR